MFKRSLSILTLLMVLAVACGSDTAGVADDIISDQRAALAAAYEAEPFGPQAPRDIDAAAGSNPIDFAEAPAHTEMNLCNIHFHEAAEHKGGQFTTYAGNGDGEGYGTGYLYDGDLSDDELADYGEAVGSNSHGDLVPGDTIEIHFVHTTDAITPGPTLGSCLAAEDSAPQLRVEGQVYVLVNDRSAADLVDITTVSQLNGLYQAASMPTGLGTPVLYDGSTTGPSYNEKGSPFQVTWSVHPEVIKVDIASVAAWLSANEFDETYAHGVRNLVTNPDLISPIG